MIGDTLLLRTRSRRLRPRDFKSNRLPGGDRLVTRTRAFVRIPSARTAMDYGCPVAAADFVCTHFFRSKPPKNSRFFECARLPISSGGCFFCFIAPNDGGAKTENRIGQPACKNREEIWRAVNHAAEIRQYPEWASACTRSPFHPSNSQSTVPANIIGGGLSL